MDQVELFAVTSAAEEIRARVAAVTGAGRKLAAPPVGHVFGRRTLIVLQLCLFGEPVTIRIRARVVELAPEPEGPMASLERLAAVASIFRAGQKRQAPRVRVTASDNDALREKGTAIRDASGITRYVGSAYPAMRWTEEKAEKERARRARQRPPKPTKKAKTRSAKLKELIGDNVDD